MLPELAEIFHSTFFTQAYVDVLRDLIAFREIGQGRAGVELTLPGNSQMSEEVLTK